MSELFETIEMKALDQAERDRIAYEERQAQRKRDVKAKRQKATVTMLTRVVTAVLICLALGLASKFNLMDTSLVLYLIAVVGAWLTYWIGAFVQFMWCKGGFMEW